VRRSRHAGNEAVYQYTETDLALAVANCTRTELFPSRRTTRRCRRSRTRRRRWIRLRPQTKTRARAALLTTRFARRLTALWATSRYTLATMYRPLEADYGDEAKDHGGVHLRSDRRLRPRRGQGLCVDLSRRKRSGAGRIPAWILFRTEVDNNLQEILVTGAVPESSQQLRTGRYLYARITWSTCRTPTVRCWRWTRIGDQSFLYVAAAHGAGFACAPRSR